MEELVGRVTGAVVTVLVDLAAGLEDPGLRAAMGALVVAARQQLALAPVDPEPLVLAILHGDPVPVDCPVEVPVPPRLAAPAYWPAVPAITDQLFAQHAANSPQEPAEEHASDSPVEPASDSPAAGSPGPALVPVHGGRFHHRPRARRKKSRQR